jgi:hypothetical protein
MRLRSSTSSWAVAVEEVLEVVALADIALTLAAQNLRYLAELHTRLRLAPEEMVEVLRLLEEQAALPRYSDQFHQQVVAVVAQFLVAHAMAFPVDLVEVPVAVVPL